MARFYGSVQGSRGEATRLGHQSSGLHTTAASWSGAVEVYLYVNDNGIDCARVSLTRWYNAGVEKVLYDGPVGRVEA